VRDRLAAPISLPWQPPGVRHGPPGSQPHAYPSSLVCAARSQREALGASCLHQRGLLLFQGDGDMRDYSSQVVRRRVQGIRFLLTGFVNLLDDLHNSKLPDADLE
jgi:hypothetical protein